ncbi:hypothetical protein GCK32_020145, partial [Trichostrongylus colubriformis]
IFISSEDQDLLPTFFEQIDAEVRPYICKCVERKLKWKNSCQSSDFDSLSSKSPKTERDSARLSSEPLSFGGTGTR